MPRGPRVSVGGVVYHVFDRANAGVCIFDNPGAYAGFEHAMAEAHRRVPMRTVSYCLMPNHWHFVLWPHQDGELSEFMHWLAATHTQRWHAAHGTAGLGHLYQGRFKNFPVESDAHFLTVCRYVERNALRAKLVNRAEEWRWSSLWRRRYGSPALRSLLSDGPLPWPEDWLEWVNSPQSPDEEQALRRCISRGQPFGDVDWVEKTARALGMESTLRGRGRPRKRGQEPFPEPLPAC